MQKVDVIRALNAVAKAKRQFAEVQTRFQSDLDTTMRWLLHEAAADYMSVEDVAKQSDFSPARIRSFMRKFGLNPKSGKHLLARTASDALHSNADLLGIDPRQMDLMSPLAYLPMGAQMRQALTDGRIKGVTGLPGEEVSSGLWCGACEFLETSDDIDGERCMACGCASGDHISVIVVTA